MVVGLFDCSIVGSWDCLIVYSWVRGFVGPGVGLMYNV